MARVACATDCDQSFGFEMTLNFGATGESSDPPQLDLQDEEAKAFVGDSIEPVEGRAVFLGETAAIQTIVTA